MKLINPCLSDDEKHNHSLPWICAMAPAKKKEPEVTEAHSEADERKPKATKGKPKGSTKGTQASKSSGNLSEIAQQQKKRPDAPAKANGDSQSGSRKAKSS